MPALTLVDPGRSVTRSTEPNPCSSAVKARNAGESGQLTGPFYNVLHYLLQAAFEIAGAPYSVTRFLALM